jgi:hypothetical protein
MLRKALSQLAWAHTLATRGGAVWWLVGLITRKSLPEVDDQVLTVAHTRHFAGHPYAGLYAHPAGVRVDPPAQPEMYMKLDKDGAPSSGQSSCPAGTIQRRDGP